MAACFFLLEAVKQKGGHHHEAKLVGVSGVGFQMTEVRGQKSEVRSQRLVVDWVEWLIG